MSPGILRKIPRYGSLNFPYERKNAHESYEIPRRIPSLFALSMTNGDSDLIARNSEEATMTTWRYQLFVIGGSGEAEGDVLTHQGLEDELNDLGRQGWELTAVTDAGDAKIFILKQADEIIVDPFAQA
jgi:hypothetical protein